MEDKAFILGHETAIIQRLQITFGKFGALRYTGNIDVAKVWERVLRRADLPILYTQGFNTRPRMQLAATLSLGISSECELLDLSLREVLPNLDGIAERIMAVAPDGLKVYRVDDVPVNSPPLQTLVRSAEYRIRFVDEDVQMEDIQHKINALLAQEQILKVVERKRKRTAFDIRPLIIRLHIDEHQNLIAHLATGERGNLRPDEVLEQMGLGDVHVEMHKYLMHLDDYDFHTLLSRREQETQHEDKTNP
jgi:radical SAM-linked protein